MGEVEIFLSVLIAGFSAMLFIATIIAYLRVRAFKLLLISIAFLAFTIKGIFLSFELYSQSPQLIAVDLFALVLLYFATIKK